MKKTTTTIFLALAVAWVFPALAQTDGAGQQGFRTFNLLLQRNIFDPTRRPYVPDSGRDKIQPPRIDRMALVGVFLDGDQQEAIFTGTQDSFNMQLKAGDMVAGFRIGRITTESLTMKKETEGSIEEIELRVGTGFRRVEDGPWELSNEPPPEASVASSTASSGGDASPTDVDRAAKLKELMERRLKGSSK